MAFIPIDPNDIEVGKPTKKSIFQRIKDNFDDHESRLDTLQAGASKVEVFNFEVFGYINDYTISELTSIAIHEASSTYDLTSFTVSLQNNPQFFNSSLSGVLEVDLQKSTDNGLTWSSVMTTKPSVSNGQNTTGHKAVNGIINSSVSSVQQGELLRITITSIKDLQGSFNVTVYGDL